MSNINSKFKISKNRLILLGIIILASFFRLYGVNWDQGYHLHPDERFLTMVATTIKIPDTITSYLDPQISTMSPYNNNYGFFVYGTLPLNLIKVLGEWTKQNTYDTIHILGRQTSAFFDIGVVLLVFLIGRKIWNEKAGLWSALLYSIMVLPIQLSHFFVVDTFLNFFIILSFYFLVQLITLTRSHVSTHTSPPTSQFLFSGALGLSFGFALACKISAIYFTPIIGLGFLYLFIKSINLKGGLSRRLRDPAVAGFVVCCLLFAITTLLAFRFGQPTAFATGNLFNWQPNPKFLANLKELQGFNSPNNWTPPSVQWKSVKPILFPFGNLIMWGLGLPLGLLSLLAICYPVTRLLNYIITVLRSSRSTFPNIQYPRLQSPDAPANGGQAISSILIILWILGLFFYQGSQTVPSMRYFLPIYPFIALLTARFILVVLPKIFKLPKIPKVILLFAFCFLLLIYPVSFLSIYSHPVTRVTASQWIYNNLPAGATILNEEWDDALPLWIAPNHTWESASLKGVSIFMYDEDSKQKWDRINPIINQADYYITSSNRAYGGLMRLPKRNPKTVDFYQGLFNGTGDFYRVAEFTSHPCFPPWLPKEQQWFCFNDDNAEENFTVFDHPKVMLFKRKQ